MTTYAEELTTKAYISHAGKTSLAEMAPETVLPEAFLIRYCGWTSEDVKTIPPSEKKAFRFGPAGRKSVKGYVLADVLKCERTKAFKARHDTPLNMTESRLKSEYFFTDSLLKKWLGEPDSIVANPHYGSAAPMRLHRIGKILLLRTLPDVEQDLAKIADKRESRSETAKIAARAKRDAWIAAFNKTKVSYHFPKTYAAAEKAARERGGQGVAEWSDTDIATRHRWTVNMLRHEFTNYDAILALALPPGMAGQQCYYTVKCRILQKIADRFPELNAEVSRQMQF